MKPQRVPSSRLDPLATGQSPDMTAMRRGDLPEQFA